MLEYHKYAECHFFCVFDVCVFAKTYIEFYSKPANRRAKIKSDRESSIVDFNSTLKVTYSPFCYVFPFYDIVEIWTYFKLEIVHFRSEIQRNVNAMGQKIAMCTVSEDKF